MQPLMLRNPVQLFLLLVGVAYIALALWCAIRPAQTSESVGFRLQPGAGQSEYFVVYGGLQLGLGLVFLWPLLRDQDPAYALFVCLLVHASLVVFRSISFVLYTGIGTTTYILSGIEWVIFLGAAILSLRKSS
jgi:hypothetical protein